MRRNLNDKRCIDRGGGAGKEDEIASVMARILDDLVKWDLLRSTNNGVSNKPIK